MKSKFFSVIFIIISGGKFTAILDVGNKPVDYTEGDVAMILKLGDFIWDVIGGKIAEDDLKKNYNLLAEKENNIRALLEEKELILKEVHHRIKNNMNIIQNLFAFKARDIKEPSIVSALKDVGNCVQSMMVLYDKLYLSERFNDMSVNFYLPALVD